MKCKTCGENFKQPENNKNHEYCLDCLQLLLFYFQHGFPKEFEQAEDFVKRETIKKNNTE